MDQASEPTVNDPIFWTRTRTAIVAGVLAAVVALSAGAYLLWCERTAVSPRDTLTAIASDAAKGDFESVAASIDTTSLVDAAVDDVLSETSATRSAVVSDYLRSHPSATSDLIKMKAKKSLEEEIREHVRAGTLPKRIPLGNSTLKALIAEAMAKKSIRSVKVDGDIAHVVVTVPYRGKTIVVKVRMRRSGATWKLDRIENMSDVLRQAGY